MTPRPEAEPAAVVERLRGGDDLALARAISIVEDRGPRSVELMRHAYPHTGRASIIGVTGAPGSGKSSLVDRLVAAYRRRARRVGVVAIDPSSAFSGGAILGDRVRMQDHAADADVFIRSMATRGHLGGLSRAANDAADLMDAAGFDPVIIETVGVGQDEVEIVKTADAVAVVLIPGMGDDIQAIKAGILEIADLFVLNKADRPGVDRLQADLDYMLSLVDDGRPRPSVLRTVAVRDEGIEALADGLERLLAARSETRRLERTRERAEARFRAVLGDLLLGEVRRRLLPEPRWIETVERIASRELDPYTAAGRVLSRMEFG